MQEKQKLIKGELTALINGEFISRNYQVKAVEIMY